MWREGRIPVSLNWTFLIQESDEDVVELGRRIDTATDCGRRDRKVFVASHPPKCSCAIATT
jgi:hypothetical protein